MEDMYDCTDNIMPHPTSDSEFRQEIIKYFLGDDWCVTDSMGQQQVNTCALFSIKSHYQGIQSKSRAIRALKAFASGFSKAIHSSIYEFKKKD